GRCYLGGWLSDACDNLAGTLITGSVRRGVCECDSVSILRRQCLAQADIDNGGWVAIISGYRFRSVDELAGGRFEGRRTDKRWRRLVIHARLTVGVSFRTSQLGQEVIAQGPVEQHHVTQLSYQLAADCFTGRTGVRAVAGRLGRD